MRILGIIPARGGSKGIPKKNLAPLCGRPLIWYTIDAAKNSKLTRTIVSTDCPEIARVAAELGAEVPFMRPATLAQDDTPTIDVVLHALDALGGDWDGVMVLQPTNPLRTVEDIDKAMVALLSGWGCPSVISYSPVGEFHPERMRYCDVLYVAKLDGMSLEGDKSTRRQDLRERIHIRDGSIYLATPKHLLETRQFECDSTYPLFIPRERSVRIDEPLDLEWAEFLLTRKSQSVS